MQFTGSLSVMKDSSSAGGCCMGLGTHMLQREGHGSRCVVSRLPRHHRGQAVLFQVTQGGVILMRATRLRSISLHVQAPVQQVASSVQCQACSVRVSSSYCVLP